MRGWLHAEQTTPSTDRFCSISFHSIQTLKSVARCCLANSIQSNPITYSSHFPIASVAKSVTNDMQRSAQTHATCHHFLILLPIQSNQIKWNETSELRDRKVNPISQTIAHPHELPIATKAHHTPSKRTPAATSTFEFVSFWLSLFLFQPINQPINQPTNTISSQFGSALFFWFEIEITIHWPDSNECSIYDTYHDQR